MTENKKIRIVDTTLRDGSHSISHQYTVEHVKNIAHSLDDAGVEIIEISHGDGLSGSSINYGLEKTTDKVKLLAAAGLKNAKIAVLLLPGIATRHDLKMAHDNGAQIARVATHVTEANIATQHIGIAKKLGMETLCFLMMAHMADVDTMVQQAEQMQNDGADCVYVVDSAGTMTPNEVTKRVSAMVNRLDIKVGFHAHNNLGLAIGNSVAAVGAGATYIDGSLSAMGAGAGNAMLELLVAVFNKMDIHTGIDLFKVMDAGEKYVRPLLTKPIEITNTILTMGYAGVYSSFLLHCQNAAKQFGLDSRDILMELGKRRTVGGQEDWIIDVAAEMAAAKSGNS